MALEHGFVIGNGHRFRRKAHFRPGAEVLFLTLNGAALTEPQHAHILREAAARLSSFSEVGVRGGKGKQIQPRPEVAFLLHLPHGGGLPRPELLLLALGTVVDQQKNHVCGKTQKVVQAQKLAKRRLAEPAKLALHLPQQSGKGGIAVQLVHDVLAAVLGRGGLLLRGGRGGNRARLRHGRAHQSHMTQGVFRGGETAIAPIQLGAELVRLRRAPACEAQVQQRRVGVAGGNEAVYGTRAERDVLFLRQMQHIVAHSDPPPFDS